MRIQVSAVDAGTLESIRDITALISTDAGHTEQNLSSDIVYSGELSFAGARRWLSQLVRVSIIDDDNNTEVLGTYYPVLSEIEILTREIFKGKIKLDGVLSAMERRVLSSSYALSTQASAIEVIQDMCSLAGVHSMIDATVGNARYSEPIFYDVGTSCLSVALEGCQKAHISLSQDRFGHVIVTSTSEERAGHLFSAGTTDTDIISDIHKSYSFITSPTRVVAAFTDSDVSLFATAEKEDSTRIRPADASLSVTDLPSHDLATLQILAQNALVEQEQETWSFSCLHRNIDAGDLAIIHDLRTSETLTGHVQSVKTHIDGLCYQDIAVKGILS